MGLLQIVVDAAVVSTALAAARRRGIVKLDLSRWPQSATMREVVQTYLSFGEKVVDFFGRYEIRRK